jgi:cell division protein FtsB
MAELNRLRNLQSRNLANAMNSIRQAKTSAEAGDTNAALAAFRQAGGYFGLADADNTVFIASIGAFQAIGTDSAALQNRIAVLETENTSLRQQNQTLNSNAGLMQTRITELEAANATLRQSEQTLTVNLTTMTNNYNDIKPNSDAYLALLRTYGVYRDDPNRLSDLGRLFDTREMTAAFPDLSSKVRIMADDLRLAASKEAISTASSIFETAIRIRAPETRKLYLEGIKLRYVNAPPITAFIDLLLLHLI